MAVVLGVFKMAATPYTINTNASVNEELGITYVTGLYNAAQQAADPNFVPLTNQQYLKYVLNSAITSYKQAYKDKLKANAAAAVSFD